MALKFTVFNKNVWKIGVRKVLNVSLFLLCRWKSTQKVLLVCRKPLRVLIFTFTKACIAFLDPSCLTTFLRRFLYQLVKRCLHQEHHKKNLWKLLTCKDIRQSDIAKHLSRKEYHILRYFVSYACHQNKHENMISCDCHAIWNWENVLFKPTNAPTILQGQFSTIPHCFPLD